MSIYYLRKVWAPYFCHSCPYVYHLFDNKTLSALSVIVRLVVVDKRDMMS